MATANVNRSTSGPRHLPMHWSFSIGQHLPPSVEQEVVAQDEAGAASAGFWQQDMGISNRGKKTGLEASAQPSSRADGKRSLSAAAGLGFRLLVGAGAGRLVGAFA